MLLRRALTFQESLERVLRRMRLLPPPAARAPDADLERLRLEVAAAKAEARAARERLADLSHEMRTPLNAVIGFSGAMGAEVFGPLGHARYYEYAEHIRASGSHLLDLVNSILDLSRIEADRFDLKREAVNVGSIALECAAMVRMSAEAAGLRLDARIEDGMPESFLDPRAVRQILINLLANAVKFTSDGAITLDAARRGDAIEIVVKDTGVGMSAEELAKIGARFTAAQGAGVRGAKGAGLGLALAFALAELHGGALRLDSAPGEGLTATLILPLVSPPQRKRDLKTVEALGYAGDDETPAEAQKILTQLERIEAYRRQRAA